MKKILSFILLGCLLSIGNLWAAEPNVSISNFGNDSSAYLKSYTSGTQTIVLTNNNSSSKMGYAVESKESAYYFKFESSQGVAAGPAGLKISASAVIDSISILITANSANKACYVGAIGWESGETTFSNIVTNYAGVFPTVTASSKKIADAKWTTLDLTSESLTTVSIAKQFKNVVVNGATKADFPSTGAQSFFLYGVKVWLHSTGGGSDPQPGDPVDPTITFNNGEYTVGGAALDLSTLFTSNSTGAVTYSVKTEDGTGAAIAGTSFTATAAGTAVVTASQAAAAGYNAKSVDANIVVSAAAPQPAAGDVLTIVGTVGGSTTAPGGNVKIHTNTDNVETVAKFANSLFADGNLTNYYKISTEGGFKAGDVISISVAFNNSDNSKVAKVAISDAEKNVLFTSAQGTNGRTEAGDPEIQQYTLLADYDELYLGRDGGTATFLVSLQVVRPAAADEPRITAADASIAATESGVEVTENIAVVGANLTGSTLTATLSPAVDGLSVTLDANTITDGAISTNAVLHYTQTVNVPEGQTTLTLSDGTTSKEVTITYSALVIPWELQSISEAKSWDFSTLSGGIRFTGDSISTEYVYANILEIVCPSSFDAMALAFTGEYPLREGKDVAQNGTLHFNTTVAGSIVVKFSDTGTSASKTAVKRYLVVNGETTEYWTSRENSSEDPAVAYDAQLNVTSGAIHVPAGDVTISGTSALVYQKLEFYPDVELTLGANGYSTFAADYKYTVSGATVYTAEYNGSDAVTLTAVDANAVIPANAGIILKGTEGNPVTIAYSNDDATTLSNNDLVGVVTPIAATAGMYVISTNAGVTAFNPCQAGVQIPAHKAYMVINGQNAPSLRIVEAGNGATDIKSIEDSENAVKFIENGKLYIQKNGVVYDVTGAKVR